MTSYTSKRILTTAVQIEVQKVSGGFYRMYYWTPDRAVCCVNAPSQIYLRWQSRYYGIKTALKEVSCCSPFYISRILLISLFSVRYYSIRVSVSSGSSDYA